MIEHAPLAEEHHHLLAGVDILEGLPQGEVEYVAKHSVTVRLGTKESFDPGKDSRSILLLLGGRVRVHELSAGGRDLTISVVEEETVHGQTGFTPRRSRALRVEALEPSVLRVVGWEDFEGLVFRKPEVGVKTISLLSERLAVCEGRLSDQVRKEVPARLASLVIGLSEHKGVFARDGSQPQDTGPLHSRAAGEHGRREPGGGDQGVGETKARGERKDQGPAHPRRGRRCLGA